MAWIEGATNLHTSFKGFVDEDDERWDDEDVDFGEFDTAAFNLQDDIEKLDYGRDPRLETEYLGNNNEFELIFICRTTWMDRDSDIDHYLDLVQEEIENGLNVMIVEREKLGYSKRN